MKSLFPNTILKPARKATFGTVLNEFDCLLHPVPRNKELRKSEHYERRYVSA